MGCAKHPEVLPGSQKIQCAEMRSLYERGLGHVAVCGMGVDLNEGPRHSRRFLLLLFLCDRLRHTVMTLRSKKLKASILSTSPQGRA